MILIIIFIFIVALSLLSNKYILPLLLTVLSSMIFISDGGITSGFKYSSLNELIEFITACAQRSPIVPFYIQSIGSVTGTHSGLIYPLLFSSNFTLLSFYNTPLLDSIQCILLSLMDNAHEISISSILPIRNWNDIIDKIENLLKDSSGEVPANVEYHVDNLIKESKDLSEISGNLVDLITRPSSRFSSEGSWLNFIKDYIDNLYVFFGQLSGEQIAAIAHFLSALVMLFCLMSVMAVIYGDYLINYLKLEEKYPRLARFIQIRRKFQHFYLFIDFSLLIVLLFGQMYINIYALSML